MARVKKTENTRKTETAPSARLKRTRRASDKTQAEITELEISRLAYQIYESRQGNGSSPLEDWLQAERQLRGGQSQSQ
jgi:hypothetical protein